MSNGPTRKEETILPNADGEIFNAGWQNQTVDEIAITVKKIIGSDVEIMKSKTDDNRSYHISSQKIKDELNFQTQFTIENAVQDLFEAFKLKNFENPLSNDLYFNIKRMNNINLK